MSADPFSLLEEPRRPLGDEERLNHRYHELTARHHPDVAGPEGDFARITLAYQTLSDPRSRLRALLEIESAAPLPRHQPVPEPIATLFASMSGCCREIDAFLKKRAATTSALGRAMLLDEGYRLAEVSEERLATLEAERARWLERIAEADRLWETGERPLALLGEAVQALGYLDKWTGQLREGLLRLQLDE